MSFKVQCHNRPDIHWKRNQIDIQPPCGPLGFGENKAKYLGKKTKIRGISFQDNAICFWLQYGLMEHFPAPLQNFHRSIETYFI